MRKFALTAIATVMAASAGVAQAQSVTETVDSAVSCDGCEIDSIEVNLRNERWLTGTSGVKLNNVTTVAPDVDILVPVPLQLENALEISQDNQGDITATKDLFADNVDDLEASATAMANVANIDVEGGLALESVQTNSGDVVSSLSVISRHGETVNVTSTAIGNAINATTTGDAVFDVNQENTGGTISASLEAEVYGTGVGEVNTAATAIANTFSLDMEGSAIGSVVQQNCADVTATNTDIIDVWRDPATATAIGNAINITKTVIE